MTKDKITKICEILDNMINDDLAIEYRHYRGKIIIDTDTMGTKGKKRIDMRELTNKLTEYVENEDIYVENRGYYGIWIVYDQDKKFEDYFKKYPIKSSEYKPIFCKEQKIEVDNDKIFCIDKISYNNGYVNKEKYEIDPALYNAYMILQELKNDSYLDLANFARNWQNNKQPYLVAKTNNSKNYLNIYWLQNKFENMNLFTTITEHKGLIIRHTNKHVLDEYF